MCNVLPPSLSGPHKVQQMEETLLQFETPSCCNQESTPVLNGLLEGNMDFLHGLICVHIEVQQVRIINIQYCRQTASNLGHRRKEMCTMYFCTMRPQYCNADHTPPRGNALLPCPKPCILILMKDPAKVFESPYTVRRTNFISCIASSIDKTAVLSTPKD
jgi:hypothetical protein